MRILVIGAGVIGSVYAARLTAAGHDVGLVARGPRRATLDREGVHLHTKGKQMRARPRVCTAAELGPGVDLTIVAVRATQLEAVLDLLEAHDTSAVAFLQHLGPHAQHVRSVVEPERAVLAFPGVGGLIRSDGSVEYVEIAAQPTTIDATAARAGVLREAVDSTGMRTALAPDMPGWLATHSVLVACLGAGVLSRGGEASALAADSTQLRTVIQAVHEGFTVLEATGTTVAPTALRVLFCRMPRWFAAAYWRRALRGPVGTVAIAPHSRASRDDEFAAVCTDVLDRLSDPHTTPTMSRLLSPWAAQTS